MQRLRYGAVAFAVGMIVAATPFARCDSGILVPQPATKFPTEPPPVTSPAILAKWVKGLVSRRHSVYSAARVHLIAAGPAALPLITKLLTEPLMPKQRRQVKTVNSILCASQITDGTPVTLESHQAPAETVLKSLCRQEGIPFETWGVPHREFSKPVTVGLLHTPFWKADLFLARASGLAIGELGGWGPQTVVTDKAFGIKPSWPHDIRGAFITCAHHFRYHPGMGAFVPGHIRLSLTVAVEPVFYVVHIKSDPRLQEVTDSRGNSLMPSAVVGYHNNRWPNQFLFTSVIDINRPLHVGVRLRKLRGYFLMDLDADPEELAFNHPMTRTHHFVVNNVAIKISPIIKKPSGELIVRYTLVEPRNIDTQAKAVITSLTTGHLIEMLGSDPAQRAVCDQTQIILHQGRRWQCESEVTVQTSPISKNPPLHVLVKVYTHFFRVRIPFEFHHLTLPGP